VRRHDEVTAAAQWAADAPDWVLTALGAKPDPLTGAVTAPSESTLRRALAGVDAADLQRLTTQWVQASAGAARVCTTDGDGQRLAGVAIDGKSVRGAAAGDGIRPHLLGAVTHDGSIVLAQRQVPDKGSEISELAALVAELDLVGKVVTVDALHTQRATAQHLVSAKGADYVMTIKANQPGLLAAAHHALSGPAAHFAEHTEQARGHGRTEERIVRTAPVTAAAPIEFPHATQVFRVIRYVGGLDGQRRSKEVAYCVTSLTPDKANGRPQPAAARPLGRHRKQAPLGPRHHLQRGRIHPAHRHRTTSNGNHPQHPHHRVPAHRMAQPQTSPPALRTRHQPMRRPDHQASQNGQNQT
jgi:predicted transposase YbfD/YdcC